MNDVIKIDAMLFIKHYVSQPIILIKYNVGQNFQKSRHPLWF